MLKVTELKALSELALAEIPEINSQLVVVSESHLSKKLPSLKADEFPILVAVIPSAKSQAPNKDNLSYHNGLLFFVLKKINYSSRTPQQEIDDFQLTQDATHALVQWILTKSTTDQCHYLRQFDFNSIQIDPEYNFLGCDGWSLSASLKTQ